MSDCANLSAVISLGRLRSAGAFMFRGMRLLYSVVHAQLAALLELPPLARPAVCHGYQFCCPCPDCAKRAQEGIAAPPAPRQPWEADGHVA